MASIDAIEGMGHRHATKLRKARVRTTESLLRRAGTRAGRRELAAATGIGEDLLLAWAQRADLLRVRGVGPEYADLLTAVGVTSLRDLRRRNPRSLVQAMAELNSRKPRVERLPTEPMVAGWISHAKELDPRVRTR